MSLYDRENENHMAYMAHWRAASDRAQAKLDVGIRAIHDCGVIAANGDATLYRDLVALGYAVAEDGEPGMWHYRLTEKGEKRAALLREAGKDGDKGAEDLSVEGPGCMSILPTTAGSDDIAEQSSSNEGSCRSAFPGRDAEG